MIEQKGMVNHIRAKIEDLNINAGDIIAQTASPCFDISIWQFLTALAVGGKTHLIDEDTVGNPRLLFDELEREQITVLESVPSLIQLILKEESIKKA